MVCFLPIKEKYKKSEKQKFPGSNKKEQQIRNLKKNSAYKHQLMAIKYSLAL